MSISDGSPVNAAYTNSKLMSRTADTSTTGKVDLNNADSASGASVTNVQREINSHNAYSGRVAGSNHDATPVWTNNDVGTSGDTLKARAEATTVKFKATTGAGGHAHSGGAGDGAPIDASDLDNINLYFAEMQTTTFDSAAGTDDDVSASFSGKTSGGGDSALGVPTTAPNNRCELRSKDSGEQIEDAGGQKVYGRLTEAAGTWTLTYYTNESGVETAHSLSTQDIRIYFKEVFDQSTRPTFPSDVGDIGSLDLTADVVDASASQRGLVSTGTQTIAGAKTFTGTLIATAAVRGDVATDAATTGANATLPAPSKLHLRVTDGSLSSIDMISSPGASQIFVLSNKTGNTITLNNETGATAGNRILTGTGSNMSLVNDANIILQYDSTSSRWVVVGGAGGITALTGDVTASGSGSVAATIANDAVTNAKLDNMATQTIKGRTTAGTGDPEDLSATQATAILNNMVGDSGAGGTKGLVPAPAAGDASADKFLHADGTWQSPASAGKKIFSATIASQSIPNVTQTVLIPTTIVVDTETAYNSGTGQYTVNETTYWQVTANMYGGSLTANTGQIEIYICVNGTNVRFCVNSIGVSTAEGVSISSILAATSGDNITVETYQGNGASRNFTVDISIQKVG